MSGTASAGSKSLTAFLRSCCPAINEDIKEADLPTASSLLFPHESYTDSEKVEISQSLVSYSHLATPGEDTTKYLERLGKLNIHLSSRTTYLGSKPSIADIALYFWLRHAVEAWSDDERTGEQGYHNIVRHVDFVQNSPTFGLELQTKDKISVDLDNLKFVPKPVDAKEEKERKKKEKAAAATTQGPIAKDLTGQNDLPIRQGSSNAQNQEQVSGNQAASNATKKKEKTPKPPKQPKAPANSTSAPLSPRLIDLRVGHILKAVPHPNADSLYVSTIACGDAVGAENTSEFEGQVVRTVCSGLNGLVPLEEMQGRKIVAVCNLKPVTMRGVKSAAMVLAASPRLKEGETDDHKGPVELVDPPQGSTAGERVNFEGWEGEPEGQLNPKKKIFETLQPGFTTDEAGVVGFSSTGIEALEGQNKGLGLLQTKSGGHCTVKTLKGAVVR